MQLVSHIALTCVLVFASYLIVLGAASFLVPKRTSRFLQGFASTPTRHYTEMSARALIGAAFVQSAPNMLYPQACMVFGWLLVVTTAGLVFLPWTWHRRFAKHVVNGSTRFLFVIGTGSLLLGAMVFCAVIFGKGA